MATTSRSGSNVRARNIPVMVRLSQAEYDEYTALAAAHGQPSLPAFFRLAADNVAVQDAMLEALRLNPTAATR